MLELFWTVDEELHQADLFLSETAMALRLVVKKRLVPGKNRMTEWDWIVWAVPGPREREVGWHGTASSLDSAKLEALDAAVSLAADLVKDEVVQSGKGKSPS